MGFQKRKEDVAGYIKSCPNFNPCPLCYGCRDYDSSYYECINCGKDKKNICDTIKHTDKALNTMYKNKPVNII